MSGGFFRGTSADQDTRFSNKQAKLLKSQKFAPELEHPVEMAKVKMDVMKPWIAKRVTELIGFEDEVLINFIYGLLEGKEVNGKEVQISLTGFMERNTGKFMKELWSLLLSAQKNVSGVPQQFLDAKEEETKKKKAETDRIANEIQRKKEKEMQELEQEKDKMDGDVDISRYKNAGPELNSKHDPRSSSPQLADEKERRERNGRRRRSRVSQSPDSADHSPSASERRRSRSISGSPPPRGRSISSERPRRSSPRRSGTPRRHSPRLSPPPRYRSTRFGRRSMSRSRHRSPSPARFRVRSPLRRRSRSPLRRRSRSPLRRRSRSPMWRRSRTPIRRSPSPVRRRSPVRYRSRSPVRRRSPSPVQRRSPSPMRRRSPSPLRRRLPSPRRRSPSPLRRRHRRSPSTPRRQSISPIRRRFPVPSQRRSMTPAKQRSPLVQESSSPSPSSLSPVRRQSLKSQKSPLPSPREAIRPLVSLRSPQRDMLDRNDIHGRVLDPTAPLHKSPSVSEVSGERSHSEQRRSSSSHGSPYQRRERIILPESPNPLPKGMGSKHRVDSSETSADDREIGEHKHRSSQKNSPSHDRRKGSLGFADHAKSRKPHQLTNSEKLPERVDHKISREQQDSLPIHKGTVVREEGKQSYVDDDYKAADKNRSLLDDIKGSDRYPELEVLPKLSRADELNARSGSMGFDSEDTDKHKTKVKEKRKHKRSERQEVESDDYSSYDSYEERKDAKRRKKEEKRLKKEERRRRREERRRRRKERHADKLKLKSLDTGSPSSDTERDHDRNASDDEGYKRRESHTSDVEETESEQKKLEIELREKALESLRAKKGTRN
ncbi:putative serine/arginine repetitive matrix protein 1-like [Abeliophyllum distichum]|uniref:Serine/arginine repetitive matrix protein 1-like n=1 Tax=Abeliophyllum distichum TaxID=126358 RepID=A0ABD1RES4_9LAMI